MVNLLVGFDSAWTPKNRGAIVGVIHRPGAPYEFLNPPEPADFIEAAAIIREWQKRHLPTSTLILLDQPAIVENERGQRPVEGLISSSIGRRGGGVQPANTNREDMFGPRAMVWKFRNTFGGIANPTALNGTDTQILETFPALVLIALGWLREKNKRLPKYNPKKKKPAFEGDWEAVRRELRNHFKERPGLERIARWLDNLQTKAKSDQDCLDACICLIVALHIAEGEKCLMVGDMVSGYIVTPMNIDLKDEISDRCSTTGKKVSEWVSEFTYKHQM